MLGIEKNSALWFWILNEVMRIISFISMSVNIVFNSDYV
jgi:hypothetical protein